MLIYLRVEPTHKRCDELIICWCFTRKILMRLSIFVVVFFFFISFVPKIAQCLWRVAISLVLVVFHSFKKFRVFPKPPRRSTRNYCLKNEERIQIGQTVTQRFFVFTCINTTESVQPKSTILGKIHSTKYNLEIEITHTHKIHHDILINDLIRF